MLLGESEGGGVKRGTRRGPTTNDYASFPMSASQREITDFLQRRLAILGREDATAVQAARWLDEAGLLSDSASRPGKPLRDLLRAGKIEHAEQRPSASNGRWFIVSQTASSFERDIPAAGRIASTAPRLSPIADMGRTRRAPSCNPQDVQRALAALDREAIKVLARDWPGGLRELDQPGLYSWWVDTAGAEHLSQGLGEPIAAGRIYAGQTGATKWPSGKRGSRTLAERIGGNHLNGRIRGSTFRLTLAACLLEPLTLSQIGAKRLDPTSEVTLSVWMRAHLAVAIMPFSERDELGDLEHHLLNELDPPLNLDGMAQTLARSALSRKRAVLS